MKKIIYVLACVVAVAAFTNCNNSTKTKTAADSAKEYADYIKNRNYDDFVNSLVFENENPSADNAQERARYSRMLRNHVEPYVNQRGGIKEVNVVSHEVTKDGKNANVVLRNNYNDGSNEDVAYNMVLVNNEWRVKTGPNREVWKTRMPDGTHVSFKFKDTDHKDVYKEHIGDERDFVKVKDYDDKQVIKVKEDGEKDVLKIKEKNDGDIVIKEKHDGHKERTRIDAEDL